MRRLQHGFSLIEVAVALFIMALLLGSILVPLTTQVEQRQISDTEKIMADINAALLGFVAANGYLPCPDTSVPPNGTENISGTQCATISSSVAHGILPYQTLGLGASDAWGNRFRYAVREEFARRPTAFTLSTTADIRVCTAQTCGATERLVTTAVAVVVSHGRNGKGATTVAGTGIPAPTGTDELENTDADKDFVSRIRTDIGSASGEFDDIVNWLALPALMNRMVTVGKLP